MKLTYCYGLEPFLVQLGFRHPGEKDTGGERGRWVGGEKKKETKNANKTKSEHTLQSPGGNWSNCKESRAPV